MNPYARRFSEDPREQSLTTQSYYLATAPAAGPWPRLEGAVEADVCVIGAGFAGLSAAIELAQRGYRVVVLEAEQVGWGASGRNGGQAIVGHASDAPIENQLGDDAARTAWGVTVEGLHLIRERIAQFNIDCDFVPGYKYLAVNERKARALHAWYEHITGFYQHPHWQWVGRKEVGEHIASPRFHSGLHDTLSGHLHPLKYCRGLARAAQSLGVRIFEDSRVTAISKGEPARVKTALGEVSARFVVLAGNSYLGALVPELQPRIMPVGTYVVASEPLAPALADSLIRERAAVCDSNFVLDYFRVSPDHRVIFGGRVSYSGMTPPNLVAGMKRRMLATFPQLGEGVKVDYSWGGFVDISMNRAPDFGRLAPNVYYLQGFSGHGLSLTGMAGRLVAEAIAGQAERFDLYARLKHHAFPGGAMLRTPALVLGMAWYRLRDLL
ncbi:FAD-binding oxidoreductase [Niveibacterium sp. 24ML]|uniref:NAD(P)/FAD-dependent oxidoreductase n=1 Tax=Niveibacterium sp. 24ML TaxID=2985512 RepID=UPI002270B10B|nr:FAD-binding oxidoreductase [Niveibacterium sp. 24ML]MCX9156407.1 FAD-binding oxidoreductase [Niveibacterium sp. 24ML]